MSGPTGVAVVDAFLRGDADGVASACSPDVLIDANVPTWRFQLSGRDALHRLLVEDEFLPERSVDAHRMVKTADGTLLEVTTSAHEHGEPTMWRELVWFHGDPAVTEITFYCTGRWDSATIARQAEEAPMVTA